MPQCIIIITESVINLWQCGHFGTAREKYYNIITSWFLNTVQFGYFCTISYWCC